MNIDGPPPPRGKQPPPRRTAPVAWCNGCGGRFAAAPDRRRAEHPRRATYGPLFCEACGRTRPFWLRPREAVRRLAAFGLISPPAGSPVTSASNGGRAGIEPREEPKA